LLLDKDPQLYEINPLKLSADFDEKQDAFAYGVGHQLADFEGKRQRGVPLEKVRSWAPPYLVEVDGNVLLLSKVNPKENSNGGFFFQS